MIINTDTYSFRSLLEFFQFATYTLKLRFRVLHSLEFILLRENIVGNGDEFVHDILIRIKYGLVYT